MSDQYPTDKEYQEQLDEIFAHDRALYDYIVNGEYEEPAGEDREDEEEEDENLSCVQDSKWYKARPPLIQQKIDQYPPDRLYRMKSTQQIVYLYSYEEGEDGLCETCTITITKRFNPTCVLDRRVFGVKLDDLEEIEEYRVVPEEQDALTIERVEIEGFVVCEFGECTAEGWYRCIACRLFFCKAHCEYVTMHTGEPEYICQECEDDE